MSIHLDPGAGDPSRLRELSSDRRLRAQRLSRAGSRVMRAASMASGAAWTGRAQEAFAEKVDATLPELTELSANLQETGNVLDVYALAVARIKDEQEILERHRTRSRDERDELVLKRHAAWIDLYEPQQLFDERAARIEQLDDQLRAVDRELSDLDDWWQSLVERRRRIDADCVAALSSRSIRGALSAFLPAAGESVEIAELLARLRELSAGDLRALAAAHPGTLEKMSTLAPREVANWWASMADDPAQQTLLVECLPVFIGGLGGVPALIRVAANRLVATERAASLRQQLRRLRPRDTSADSTQQYATHHAVARYLEQRRALEQEIAYLNRVRRGDVQLYLYDPVGERVVEMFGDPDRANVLLTLMPGTNTTMESYYTAQPTAGITALIRWQVERPSPGVMVAGFVTKLGRFPQTTDLWSDGPQHNWFADTLGRRYALLTRELDAITGGTPIVSVEHSFGSAAGGEAERRGAKFSSRLMLAGIGMKEGWEPRPGTTYLSAQGPADVNRHLDGVQSGGLGYAITPRDVAGIREIDTGYTDGQWAGLAVPVSPLLAGGLALGAALDQHNRLLDADLETNEPVMLALQDALGEVARR